MTRRGRTAAARATHPMAELASSFHRYGAWRDALSQAIQRLRGWLDANQLLEPDAARRFEIALDRLHEDKLVIAFVAEFSRGKSELINAIFFADYGKRILPSSAGRTTMCPTELLYDESLPPCIRVLPIETRARLSSTADLKRAAEEWRVFPVDVDSPDGMLEAFRLVADTTRVPVAEARRYGLFDPDDPDQALAVEDGTVEISRWRHAVINFPHPLLRQGLVILDTPGLNAIGTEPELTLSLVPSAHAVLFVLAADTGVTKSDLEVWRHIVGDGGAAGNHIAVLNKIDGLWDSLKSEAEIEAELAKQVGSVAHTLALDAARVFPVSAQKGLVAKVTHDGALLARSRLPRLESALIDLLVPAKQRIVREQTQATVERIVGELRQTLLARERGLIEQLYELRALQGKNQGSIERMLARAQAEQRDFESNVRRIVATRVVMARLSDQAFAPLRSAALRATVLAARERMRKSQLTPQFAGVIRDYFAALHEQLRSANAKLLEIEQMVLGVQRKFAEELGWSLAPPMPFSLDTYVAEIERAEVAYRAHFSTVAVLTHDKWALIERFFETVVSRSRQIFSSAERDAEAWTRSLLPPIEVQVREQRAQLKKRAENVARIRGAQETLDERIGELEDALEDVQQRLADLDKHAKRARRVAAAPVDADRPAAGRGKRAAAQPAEI